MSSFIDCPHCSSEIIVSEDMYDMNLRCPDCLQWIGDEFEDAVSIKAYYGASVQVGADYDNYDMDNYEYSSDF